MTWDQTPSALLLANLPLIKELVAFIARRNHLDSEQARDLESFVRLRLVDNDYAVFRQWRRHSSLRTYLTVVVQRFFHDYANEVWGRWRPSAAAVRLGPLAQALEEQLYRDGATFDEACGMLASRHRSSRAELAALREQLPHRSERLQRHHLGSGEGDTPSPDPDPEEAALRRAGEAAVTSVVAARLRHLPARERLLLRLRFKEGLPIPAIARGLGMSEKQVKRHLQATLAVMRGALRQAGLERHDVVQILEGRPDLQFGVLLDEGESEEASPSKEGEEAKDREQG